MWLWTLPSTSFLFGQEFKAIAPMNLKAGSHIRRKHKHKRKKKDVWTGTTQAQAQARAGAWQRAQAQACLSAWVAPVHSYFFLRLCLCLRRTCEPAFSMRSNRKQWRRYWLPLYVDIWSIITVYGRVSITAHKEYEQLYKPKQTWQLRRQFLSIQSTFDSWHSPLCARRGHCVSRSSHPQLSHDSLQFNSIHTGLFSHSPSVANCSHLLLLS